MTADVHFRKLEHLYQSAPVSRWYGAFFAVNSRVPDVLVLTVGFTIHLMNPVSQGDVIAEGRIVHEAGRLFVAESELRDHEGLLLAKGSGTFTRSRIALGEEIGYRE